METMTDMTVAKTILEQMGGIGRISAMTGAYNFIASDDGVSFRFKGSKTFNYVKIKLTGMDLYDVEIGQIRKKKGIPTVVPRSTETGLYFDMLKPIFEKVTGLYLSL
jgi:hypothetical protein